MTLAAILLAAAVAAPAVTTATLPGGERVVWIRGEAPELRALPRAGEGWTELAARLTRGRASERALRDANSGLRQPLRDVRVRVPWELLGGRWRVAAIRALFPADQRTARGWEHLVVAPWDGDGESWWELAEWLCGDGSVYPAVREANPELGLYPPKGSRIVIPAGLLATEFRDLPVSSVAELRPSSTPLPAREARLEPGPLETAPAAPAAEPTPEQVVGPAPPAQPRPVPTAAVVAPPLAPSGTGEAVPLEYRDGEAIYRLQAGEALYSAVVVRFTGQLHAADVNATAAELARWSGIADVTTIPIGYPVRIPFDLLLPEFLPPGSPRRVAWERERQELSAIRRVIRAANLDGIHIILDAGHGGGDSGATFGGVWESTYTYDVMARLRRVLERETRATVWTTVRDLARPTPPDEDELPISRAQQLLVEPPYDLSDPSTGVNLRWVLSNSILQRLQKRRVNKERVVFVSIHADSLHPAVRGMMVYVPARGLRPERGPSPRGIWDCREARETRVARFPASFRSRAEALSTQLGETIIRAVHRYDIRVHPFQPVRSAVLRGGARWVPAVLRNSEVPTAVLIEICNLNNSDDRALLLSWRFREKLAHAIAAGLAESFSR